MTLFELAATLTLNTSEFKAGVDEATRAGSSLAETLGTKVTAKAVALGNALYDAARKGASALVGLAKDSVQAAADVQAENAQFAAAFGDLQAAASSSFKTINQETNIMDTRLRNVGTKAFSQFKGAGMDNPLVSMEKYLRLAADAAAYYDISLEDADTRLRSFLRGNVEAGDAIGLFTSESQRNSYALETYGLKWQELNEAQRQSLLLDVANDIYEQSGAIGQASRESASWANVLANLKETWRQTLALVGGPLLQSILPAMEKLTTWLQENPAAIQALADSLGKIASMTIDGLIAGFEWLEEHGPALMETVSGIASTVASLFGYEKPKTTLDKLGDMFLMENGRGRFVQEAYNIEVMNGNEEAVAFHEEFQQYLSDNGLDISADVPEEDLVAIYEKVKAKLSSTPVTVNVQGAWTGFTGSPIGSFFGSFLEGRAVGMDYVPYDNYVARLHEGEAVLTKAEATSWRRGEGQGVDVAGIVSAVVQGVREGMRGLSISMDGQAVGDVVTDRVSQNIARAAWAGRYGG